MTGRFDPGSAFGDRAAAVSLEARWGPLSLVNGRVTASPFIFFDGVNYWNEDSTGVSERWVSSAGGGVRFEAPGGGRLDVLWAKPLRAPLGLGEPEPNDRLLINLTVTLDDLARRAFSRTRSGANP